MSTANPESISLQELLGDQSSLDRPNLALWMRTIDDDLWRHARAVANLVRPLATILTTNARLRKALVDAAWFHDIGKLSIPTDIALKPGALDTDEWKTMRRHPAEGADYLAKCPKLRDSSSYVRHHHERFDGDGYPDHLKGEAIPLGARIVGIADAYHAMISLRPYRLERTADEALQELRHCSGTQFDPLIVDVFIRVQQNQAVGSIR